MNLEFNAPPKQLTITFNAGSYDVHCGLVPDNAGTPVLVAISRNRKASHQTYDKVCFEFLTKVVANEPSVRAQLARNNVQFRLPKDEEDFQSILARAQAQ